MVGPKFTLTLVKVNLEFRIWNFAVISQFRITLVNSFLLSFHQYRPFH